MIARRLTADQIAASDRSNYVQAAVSMAGNAQQGISNTLQNHKIPAATRAAVQGDITALYRSSMQQLGAIYNVNLNWG